MDAGKIKDLKFFVDQCKANPDILNDPSISFFREYLESLGCKIPASAHKYGGSTDSHHASHGVYDSDEDVEEKDNDVQMESESDDELIESDIELDGDTVEPDNDPPQKMGDQSIEVTDENREAAQIAKGTAMEAISEGKFDEAIDQLTNAILLNPSAIMYSSRASVFIKMKKPCSAIRDASAALEINPDSAKGYKSRGIALAMLGNWEAAAKDLHVASKLDYDEEIMAALKKVEPNAHKIEEHTRKYERLRKERTNKKMERQRQRRRAEAQAAYNKAKKKETSSGNPCGGCTPGGGCSGEGKQGGMPGGFPGGMPAGMGGMPGMGGGMPAGMGGGMPGMGGGMPGMGGMPGGVPGNIDMSAILNDPELLAAFKDPEVMAALQDVMKNPANFAKHQSNPKVAPVIEKMMKKFSKPT
ncbi:Hsc70-interacting protein [Zostera marina]|uniref:Hsc70-interacting protein n=1 Tax=Zostera marina TaxID=29655 RepID=A0A0K9NL92_ZOSMR|nr:Hsc70-interacting protein [Zostera marina]